MILIRHLEEMDTKMLFDFFEANDSKNVFYVSPLIEKEKFEKIYLRRSLYNYSDEYIVAMNEQNAIIGMIIVSLQLNKMQSANIDFIYLQESVKDIFHHMIEYVKNNMRNIMIKYVMKLRIYVKLEEKNEALYEMLLEAGFKKECVKEEELLETYIYWLK